MSDGTAVSAVCAPLISEILQFRFQMCEASTRKNHVIAVADELRHGMHFPSLGSSQACAFPHLHQMHSSRHYDGKVTKIVSSCDNADLKIISTYMS